MAKSAASERGRYRAAWRDFIRAHRFEFDFEGRRYTGLALGETDGATDPKQYAKALDDLAIYFK